MDPHPPFDHRRAHPGHHYPDQHRLHYADQHLAGGGAAPARSRYDYDSHPSQYLPSDHQHHFPRIEHQPPPPPPPHYRHDTLPLRAPPETPPPYRSLSPPHNLYQPQLHGGDDFRAAAEIRRVPSRHNQHHHMREHHHHQPQLPWSEAEEERRRYSALQGRLSPSDSRKRQRCALHDSGDLDGTEAAPPRRQRLHQHSSYSSGENLVDRTASRPHYSRHEGFIMHSNSKGNRKMQASTSAVLPDLPRKIDAGYPRRAPQKSAPARMSVWERIEENPSMYMPSPPRQLPKGAHISPSKTKKTGYGSKELASVISLDCKAMSPSKTKSTGSASKESGSVISLDPKVKSTDCRNSGSNNGGTKKSTGTKSDKVLASVLVKPSTESKEKETAVKQASKKPDKVQNNVPGFINGSAARPGTGVKKVKKIVIKKIVRKIGASDKQTSSKVIPEQKDSVAANANDCEKEEGEITAMIAASDNQTSSTVIPEHKDSVDANSNDCEKEEGEITTMIGASDNQTSSTVIPEQKDSVDANANDCEKEEGEITTMFGASDKRTSTPVIPEQKDRVEANSDCEKEEGEITTMIGASDKRTSSPDMPEQNDSVDANANDCEKEEGEITTSLFEKDDSCAHNLISTCGIAEVGGNVVAEKEQRDHLLDPCKSNYASAIEFVGTVDTMNVCGSQHPEKEADKSLMIPDDINTTSFDTIGNEHPRDRGYMDLGDQNAAPLCENGGSLMKEDCVAVSDAINVGVASNSPRMHGKNNADIVNEVKDGTKQAWESVNDRSKNSNILLGSNGGHDLFTSTSRSSSIAKASVTMCKDAHRKEGSGMGVASLGESMGTPKIDEPLMTLDTQKEERTLLTSPREKGTISVSSWGTFNSMELNINKGIQDKDGRIPMEPSKANASVTQYMHARAGLEASVNEDTLDKDCITSIELHEATSSMTHHERAPNEMEFSMNENIQKEGNQMSNDSNTSKTIWHLEAPNRADVFTSEVIRSETCRRHMGSDEKLVGSSDNSIDVPDFVLSGRTEDICTQELLHGQRITSDKANLEGSSIMLLDHDPVENSFGPIILNNDAGKDTVSQATEPMHLQTEVLSPDNNLSLLHSDNWANSAPTALTLGNNTYFRNAESDQPNGKLMEPSKVLGDVTMTEFGKIGKGTSKSCNDLIKADAQNWLALPVAVNNVNNATFSEDGFDLEQNVAEGTSGSQDHGSMPEMDQCGRIGAFNGQDHSLKLSSSNVSQSDLLALKGRNKNIANESEIVVPESSVCSVNVLNQYGYCTVDRPVGNINKPIILSSPSAGATGGELRSSQVYVDSGHANHRNTMDSVVESSIKPALLSSWTEATVSEGTKEQPCKSTPDMLSGPNEDTRKALSDPLLNARLKSPPRMNIASSTVPKVPTKPVSLPGSSREALRLNPNARHRTWHRDNVSSGKASQPSGLPPKLPLKKNGKSCYIRKGNALIRNPATGNHPQSSSGLVAPCKLSKPIMRQSMNFVRKVDSNNTVPVSVERPKTPPLPLHTKSISMNISEQFSQSLQTQQVPETEKRDSSEQVNSGVDNPRGSSVQKSEPLDAGKVVYVRPKSNQLVASQGQQSGNSVNSSIDKVPLLQPPTTSDLYFKKRKNQIILGSSTSDVSSSKDMSQTENSNTGKFNKVLMFTSSNKNLTVAKDTQHKAHQITNTVGSSSHVWTLSGQHPQRKPLVRTSHVKALPHLLPWKRKIFSHSYRSNYSSLLNTSSLGIVRKLLKTRKRGTIYTVSTNGFSLRKSGLLSFDGSSLKWSRSLEKGSQKVNEEATLAVSEIDGKKRERRKRQSLRNKGRNDQYSLSVAARNNSHTSSDSTGPSTCNEYVRINKGNQLVRNPKKVIRMLASEKVRWSLHTVRSRLAKKQQYCQFFTRFGECKKSGGKCPYIHDRAKIAICTKFLRGLCSNASCKLTHKVLPERMPDCSYFLRGLCSNTTCPYRHVKVNTNAPVCEDFLKGYCAGGDECHKKHSYVCPVFEATGECPQQSRCKLHHPKKQIKSKRSRADTLQNNSWGRYFDSSIGEDSEAMRVYSEEDKQKQEQATGGDLSDYIDLGADVDDDSVDLDGSNDIHLMELDSRNLKIQADNVDALIKPLRIMRTARV